MEVSRQPNIKRDAELAQDNRRGRSSQQPANSPAVASEEEWLHRVVPTSQTGTGHGGMMVILAR